MNWLMMNWISYMISSIVQVNDVVLSICRCLIINKNMRSLATMQKHIFRIWIWTTIRNGSKKNGKKKSGILKLHRKACEKIRILKTARIV